jgi:hypothetical protein
MKKIVLTLALVALAATTMAQKSEPPERRAFGNMGVSLNAGSTGTGLTLSTPIGRDFTVRAGFGHLPYTFRYTDNDLPMVSDRDGNAVQLPPVKAKGKVNVPAGHLLIDYAPFERGWGAFHLTAGLYMGSSRFVHVHSSIDLAELDRLNIDYMSEKDKIYVDVGDARIRPADNGTFDAYAEVNPIRPYFGLGWGNAVPKRRVGFRFDIGAMYHGVPRLTSPTMEGEIGDGEDVSEINKILKSAQFWPQIQIALTVRLFDHK